MKKYIIYTLLGSVALFSCQKEENNSSQTNEDVRDVSYTLSRGGANEPADETTYTFVSYKTKNWETDEYEMEPYFGFNRPIGKYAYLRDPIYHGIYQPCDVNASTNYSFVKRNARAGQGLSPTKYKTVCLHPAVDLEKHDSQYRVVYTRDMERYASDAFKMITTGYEIFELEEELPIYDLRSKVVFDIVQGGNSEFTIEDPLLINPGHWAWYHPYTQVVSLSYDASNKKNIYVKDKNETTGNEVPLTISTDYSTTPASFYKTGATGKNAIVYSTYLDDKDGIFFFPNDYTGDLYLQPGMEFTLKMGGKQFRISIPFNIKMERSTRYKFRILVESEVIKIFFKVIPWNNHTDTGDVGDPAEEIIGKWNIEDWQQIYEDTENIG